MRYMMQSNAFPAESLRAMQARQLVLREKRWFCRWPIQAALIVGLLVWVGTLSSTGCTQHRQDVSEPKVIVSLLGQLLFTESIQNEELLGQYIVFLEPTCSQLDFHDDLPVWHHHSHTTEQSLRHSVKFQCDPKAPLCEASMLSSG